MQVSGAVLRYMDKPLAIVLAAGKGTRMKSDLPKVLCQVCGRPMIHFVLDALQAAGVERQVVVVGYRADDVRRELAGRPQVTFAEQKEQLGTGHAVMMCREQLAGHHGPVLILAGDSPLAQRESLAAVLSEFQRSRPACVLGTLHKTDPRGLGRIVRDPHGKFTAIVEEKDATDEQKRVTEVNMSTYVFDNRELLHALGQIDNQNRQREYYLTDCPSLLAREGKDVRALPVLKPCEALSINTLDELKIVEAEMRKMGYPCAN
jgi:bifunctional UDP-N-acetylglucosamine pyrophosphorylase/glucosamine-1-phosphate N-acetyltransferase/UDP-N-acetylglucosamine pyrophosphorylase